MSSDDRFVPKIHPLDRLAEPEDPMELIAEPVQGDPEVMLECILQEFLWMGWDAEQLVMLFDSPMYPVLGQLREYFGDAEVRRRVHQLVARTGVIRFREVVVEPEEEPEVVELMLPGQHSPFPAGQGPG